MTLISRDCCPYLDDYEPNYYNPAVVAVAPTNEKSVTWDPLGPSYDEPKPSRKPYVRPNGRHPLSADPESDDSSDDDLVDDRFAAVTQYIADSAPRAGESREDSVARRKWAVSVAAAGASGWTGVGKYNPQPIKLSHNGIYNIHELV